VKLPTLAITNRQRGFRFDLPFIRNLAAAALPACVESCLPRAPLKALPLVEVAILSDARIARVHGEFFEDPTPTDVITFQHGEILLGAETIGDNARGYHQTASEEAARCIIHGLLHLAGWDDLNSRDQKKMIGLQERIFKRARRAV